MRAQARRRQAGVLLPERADPYAEEMKRIADEQKARAAAEKEAAKAAEEQAREAEKARQAAEKAALAEENNAKEKQYRREKRPMYVDADGRIQSQVTDEEWQKQRAQKAKNDELRTRYFQQNRPWIEDAAGNIIPRQTDEEWQAAQNEKAAKLEAAKVDKANESLRKNRKQEITGVQRGMTDAREAINLRTSELELQHSEATAQAKRRVDFIKQTQDQIENGLDLAPDRVARMEAAMQTAQQELEQWQAKADALDAEVRSQKAGELAFRKAQQPVASAMQAAEDAISSLSVADAPMGISSPPKPGGVAPKADVASVPAVRDGVLSHQQAAIASDPTLPAAKRKAALEDIAARRDPVAYAATKRKRMRDADAPTLKAALDEEGAALQARLEDYQQRMAALANESAGAQQAVQSLLQRNQQRLQQPHKGADLVTVDGPDGQPMSVFADLADEYQDSLAQWQDKREKLQAEADLLDTEAEEIKLDQQLYHEGVNALNAKAEAEHTARRKAAQQEQDAKLRRMELTGQAGPAAKIRQMQADLAVERAVIDEMFPEDSPEKRQQIDKLRQKAEQQQAEITREVHGLQRFGAMLYDRFKDVSTNFIDRSTTDPEGIEASDTTNKIIDDAAKAKGLNPEDVRRVMETQRVLDWRKPLSGTAARMQENVLSGLWEKEFGPIEAARLLPDGGVIPNPVLGGDKAAFDKAIQESGASKKAQAEAQKLWPEYQRRFGEAAADALMQEPDTPGSFQDYRAEMIQRDQDSGGKLGFARLSPGEQAIRYLENRGTRRGDEKWAQLIGRNLYAGFGDFATQVLGVGAAVTGNEDLSNLAVENQRNMESVLTGQQYGGPKGLTAGIVGQSARMLPGLAATVGTGSLGGAIAMGGVQTGGANYAETYQALREAGVSHEDAWQRSAISAYVSGAMTAALTKAFPGGATAMLKPGAAAAGKRAMTNAVMTAVKAVGKGFADEVPQEVLDEGFSQLTAATAAGKPLNEAVRDFVTGLPELIGAAGLLGGAGGALEGGRTESVPPLAPQPPPQAEAENISAPASNISPAPRESELSKPDMGSEGAGDRFMAARGAVAAWDGGSMPEAKKAVTKAKAEVLIKIAEGATPADLEQEELMAVGLRREDDGRITSGYLTSKGDWKKGPRPDGFTSVELLDGQFIITDRQVDRLRKVGMDAVVDAIAKTAAERRKEIMGEVPAPAPEPEAKADTPAQAAVNKPVSASEDVIPMEWAAPAPAAAASLPASEPPSLVSPEVKQRTAEIATVLEKSGVPRDVVLDVAGKAVEASGIDPDGYASQMMSPAFDAAMKSQGWVRKPSNPMQWEPAELTRARTGPEMAQQKASMRPAEVVKAEAKPRQELSAREDWRKARESALRTQLAKLEKLKDRAKAKEEFTKITRADKVLVDLVDNRYGALFDEVRIGTNPAGLAAMPLATDEKGRATKVALLIDPANFYAHGGLAPLEIEKALEEELAHRVDLMVSSRREAIDLAQAIHKARPGVFDRVWQDYFAIDIREGNLPAKVPAVLTDEQAYMLYFEATRMIHQGTLTTETIQDVGTLRQIWRYLQSWLKHVRREMRKLPKELLGEWNARIEAAEKLLQKLEARAVALEKAALDDVEPPEFAVRKPRQARQPQNDPELDAELQAAWEAEQKSRRHVPTFTPTQQALRNLRALKDPDNDEINILSRIAMEGGIEIYSDKARKLRKQQGKPVGGELDWLEKANLTPFWKGIVFRRGNVQTIDQTLQLLHEEGYFPEAATEADVTGEMLAAKLEDVLARYQALKEGQGDLADADEQHGSEMAKLERQRVEFERATADGPLKVRPADLKPGDVMQVKGDDGKLHPVEVLSLETRPLDAGEDYDPQGNPGHRLGPDGPEVIESVTLKDGTTFGVQMVDGQEGLYVDEFKVKDAYDFHASLRDAVLTRKLTDDEALLHFMDHEGLGADTPFAEIVTQLQSKLRIPMKRAQELLRAVFDTAPRGDNRAEIDTDNPLGAARKRADSPMTPAESRIGIVWHASPNAFEVFDTSKEGAHFGTAEQAGNLRGKGKTRTRAYLLNLENPLRVPDLGTFNNFNNVFSYLSRNDILTAQEADTVWAAWNQSDDAGWDKLKQSLESKGYDGFVYENEVEGAGDSYTAWRSEQIRRAPSLATSRKRGDAGPSMFGEDFDLLSGDSQNRGLFEQALGTRAAVESAPSGFALEAVTPEQLDAEMAKAARKAKLQARQEAPLVGTAGEYGTPDLLDVTAGPMALFSQPAAARGTLFTAPKRALMRAEQDAANEPPPARPDLDDYLPPKAERKTSGKVATGVKQWHGAFKQWKQQFAQWAERQGKLGAFLAPPVKSAFGPMYQRANVVTPKAGGGWRTTVFGRYEPDGITEMSGDWADGAWVPIGHHEFESQAEAYEDAMSGMDGAEFTRRALFAAAKRVQDTGTLFGEDQMMFLGDRGTKGLFEAPGGMARLGDKETRRQGDAPESAKTTNPAKSWALSLPSSETGELPPLKDATKPLGLADNATPFKPGQITADHWGDDPFVYRDEWVDPRTLKDAFNLEGLTYEQVVNMPSTQQYMQWFREGNVPPPITLVFNEPEKRLRSISRRRVVAALETGQTRIPARVDIGKASTVMGKVSNDTPAAAPMEPMTQALPNVVDSGAVPMSQSAAAATITKEQAAEVLKDSALNDRPIRTYEQAVAANQIHMGTQIRQWSAFPFTGEVRDGRPIQDLSGGADLQKAPTLFPSSGFVGHGNCEWCGKQPVKNFYHIKHDGKGWSLAVGSECIGHFANMSGDSMAGAARQSLALTTIAGLNDARRTLSKEFSEVQPAGYGRTERVWRNSTARSMADEVPDILGKITLESGPAAHSRWLNTKLETAREWMARYDELMARPATKKHQIDWRTRRIIHLESDLKHRRELPDYERERLQRQVEELRAEKSALEATESPAASPSPSPQVSPSSDTFTLESVTGAELDAEAQRKKQREEMQARQDKPLIGTQGDIGQMDMLGGGDLFAQPAAKEESGERREESPKPAEPRIGDFGEKIGGARKDSATKGEKAPKSATPAAESQDPGWRKRYEAVEIVSGKDKGRWSLIDLRKKDWTGAPQHATRTTFASEAEARQHIPLIAVARNHGVYSVGTAEGGAPSSEALKKSIEDQMKQINALKMGNERLLLATGITERFKKALADGQLTADKYAAHVREGTILSDAEYAQGKSIQEQIRTLQNTPTPEMAAAEAAKRYGIFRNVTDRKRVRVVDETFNTYEDGMRYLAQNAEAIIETKTSFGEEILAKPENAVRVGPERRTRPADAAMFQEAFGFRGVEFGNWMRDGGTESERQEVLNHAYDGLQDLAEVLGIPPRAISLNGELSLAFGARGHGLTGAKAHYERDYAVINLTKMAGAGSLAHEWFHALDHYLGRQDGKAARERKPNEEGNLAFPMKGREGDYVSHGFGYKSDVREELRARYKELMDRMFTKAEQFVEDTEKAEKFVSASRQWVVDQLASIRKELAEAKNPEYYKRNNKPATQEQLDAFDTHSARILEGEALTFDWRYNQAGDKPASARGAMTGRWSNDTLDAMNEIVKSVRGRSGFNKEGHGMLDQLRGVMKRYGERLKMLADATAQTTKSKMVPTNYAMDAKRIDQGRASEYWATPHEMAARAFAGYVEDKLQDQGRASEFLAYGSDNNLPQYRIFKVRPFPAGDERKHINGLFDAFFKELKVKQTEQGMMLYAARKRGDTPPAAPFYSKLEQVIEQKMPNRADAKTIWGLITNPQTGIKQEELKWSGILPWLEAQGQTLRQGDGETGRLSKQAVLDYLASDGAVRLEEVRLQDRLGPNQLKDGMQVDSMRHLEKTGGNWRVVYSASDETDFEGTAQEVADYIKDAPASSVQRSNAGLTKFAQYQLPGGESYREVVLALPPKAPKGWTATRLNAPDAGFNHWQINDADGNPVTKIVGGTEESAISKAAEGDTYTSSHFPDVPNYVAHLRLNDRVDAEGRPGTLIEEIQSDRHQAGREKGYLSDMKSAEEIIADRIKQLPETAGQYAGKWAFLNDEGRYEGIRDTKAEAIEANAVELRSVRLIQDVGRVPDAPFRKDWPLQMFKRALADAVAADKQWIGWTTGDTQAARYDLSKQLSRISYEPNENGTFDFEAYPLNDDLNPVISESDIDLKRIEELAGKEVAKKVQSREGDKDKDGYRDWHHLRGLNLRVGGEGMKGFYDTILPKEIGKYVKQWGAGVVKGEINSEPKPDETGQRRARMGDFHEPTPIWRVDITPAMRAGVEAGQALFAGRKRGEQRAEGGESERVVAAALRDPRTGRVFTGITHGHANPRSKKQLDLAANGADPEEGIGFVTSTGRYVTQAEAERVWGIQGSESSAAYWEASKPQIVDGEGDDGWVEPMSEADWKAELARRRAAEAEMAGKSVRVAEEPFKLDNGAIQGYFDLPDVQVPASKQEAAREAIQNALQGVSVSAAKGAARDAARRAQARRAYGGLIARDVDAIREGLAQGKGRISVLMHEFIRHEIPGFNIRGAIIENPADFAAFNLAVRSPFFESVKIAVLGDGQQVIHSQILHVGALNESTFSPRMIAAVIGEARRANPKQEISGIVIGHNHPSGDPSPSDADKRATRKLEEMMEVLGIPLTDHVITNGEKYFSFRESGTLRNGGGWSKRKPKLPVLPTPEQRVVGWGNPATGNMADWEAAATSQRPEIGAPEKAKPYLEALATADPGHMHAVYVDTRMQLMAVERLDRNSDVARVVIESASREGAYGVMLSQPNQSADPAPSDAFRRLVRRVNEAVRAADIKLLDAIVGSTTGQQFSFAMQGLIGETAATYTVDAAAHEAATSPLNDLPEPTEAQKEAGNYQKGHVRIAGHEISIENPAGSKRRPEWPALKDHYGYFKGTNAKDGDHVDVFVKPGTPEDYAGPVHVVRQNKVERGQKTGQFDEYKVMLGYPTAEEAREAYLRNYEPGWPGLHKLSTHSPAEFQKIKDTLFTVPPDRVPGVREADKTLRQGEVETGSQRPADTHTFPDGYRLTGAGLHTLGSARKRAYHGTPHKVDRFRTDKIGTGEGAQAYGWGLYFAEGKGTAEWYRDNLSGMKRLGIPNVRMINDGKSRQETRLSNLFAKAFRIHGPSIQDEAWQFTDLITIYNYAAKAAEKDTKYYKANRDKIEKDIADVTAKVEAARAKYSAAEFAALFGQNPTFDHLRTPYMTAYNAAMKTLREEYQNMGIGGNLYTVELLPDESEFLDWDRPLSEQSEKVKAAMRELVEEYHTALQKDTRDWKAANQGQNLKGFDLMAFLQHGKKLSAQEASKLLASLGIPGIRYLDGGSRGAGDGTRNYVIFDENLVRILEENGQPVDGTLSAAPKRRDNPAAAPGVIPPAATAEDFARPDNALLRGMSNADWNRLDKGIKKRLDRILEPIVRYASAKGDAAVEKMLDWVVGESLEGLEHAAGTTLEDVQQRKSARESLRAQVRRAWQKTVRQVMPDATVPADVLAKLREMRAAESLSQEKALDVSKRALEGKTKLLDIMAGTKAEEFKSPDVRRKMYLAMNAKINSGVTMDDLTPEQRAVALALKRAWWENGMRRVRNGTLKLETFQDMAEGLPQYYEDDVNLEKGFIPRAFKMGLKGLIAQRSTRFHIVDKTSKDKSGEFALVNWTDPSTKRTDWKYKSKAHMDAAYEQIIEDQILAAKDARAADYGKLAPDDIRTLRQYTWMTDADRAALAGVTREKLRQPASLTAEQKAVVDRMTEQLHRRFQKKVPLTYQQHEKAGLIQDPFYSIGRALLESGHDNATAEFFNYIAKQPDYVRDVAENGFTAMPDDPKMGRLAGKWVRDDVAAELEQMLDVPNMVMRFYDALLAGFKYGHTILNLGSHVRNILGNVSFAVLAGSNPLNPGNAKAYAEANKLLREGGPTFEALHKLGILGGDYLTNEVRRALRQLLPDPDTVERMIAAQDMSWLTGLKEQMARKLDKGGSVLAAVPRAMENAWKWEDDIYKVAAFIKARQQGMSEEEAAAHVRKWFPFYDKGSSGTLKALGRFVFPFLSFKRESLRIMGHALRERPLAFLTMMAIPRLLTQLSFTILELQLIAGMAGLGDDDEEDLLKDMKGKAGGLLAPFTDASLFSIALPWRDANGGMAQWDLSAVIPWSDWLSTRIEYGAEKPWFQRVASQIVSGAPFASLLVETWANQDTFSGRRIWEDDMSGTEKAGRLAEHIYMKLAPPMIGPHVAAMKRSLEQQPSKLLPARNPTQALMRILGIDIKPLAPDLYRKAEEYRKAKGAPAAPRGGQAFPQDAASRARARLYLELIQPEINVQAADEAFAALKALGEPVRTLKDLSDLFKDRNAETIMPAKMRPGFVQSLPPESRRVYDSARTQQGEAFTRSKSVLQQRAEARRRAAGMTNDE